MLYIYNSCPVFGSDMDHFVILLGAVLRCIFAYEEIHATPLGLTWLPVIETYLKTIFDQELDLENSNGRSFVIDMYILLALYDGQGGPGPCGYLPEDRDYLSSDFNLLLIATYFGIYSYVEINLRTEESIEKAARPLLHFILVDSFSSNRAFDLAKFLLEKGCRPDDEYLSETHWEFLLLHIIKMLHDETKRAYESFYRILLLLLAFGADVNQKVDAHKRLHSSPTLNCLRTPVVTRSPWIYECSTLHLMLMKDVYNTYEQLTPILQIFLDIGADMTVIDSDGCSVIQMAEKNWPQAVDLLKRHLPAQMPND